MSCLDTPAPSQLQQAQSRIVKACPVLVGDFDPDLRVSRSHNDIFPGRSYGNP